MAKMRHRIVRIATSPFTQWALLTIALTAATQLPGANHLLEAAQVASTVVAPYQPHPIVGSLR